MRYSFIALTSAATLVFASCKPEATVEGGSTTGSQTSGQGETQTVSLKVTGMR